VTLRLPVPLDVVGPTIAIKLTRGTDGVLLLLRFSLGVLPLAGVRVVGNVVAPEILCLCNTDVAKFAVGRFRVVLLVLSMGGRRKLAPLHGSKVMSNFMGGRQMLNLRQITLPRFIYVAHFAVWVLKITNEGFLGIVGWWLGGGGSVKVRRLENVSVGIRRARVGIVGRKMVQRKIGKVVCEASSPVLGGQSVGHDGGCSRILRFQVVSSNALQRGVVADVDAAGVVDAVVRVEILVLANQGVKTGLGGDRGVVGKIRGRCRVLLDISLAVKVGGVIVLVMSVGRKRERGVRRVRCGGDWESRGA